MEYLPFKRLHDIYFRRAKEMRKRHALIFALCAVVMAIALRNGFPKSRTGDGYLAIALIVGLNSGVRLASILYGMPRFKSIWRSKVAELEPQTLALCEAVDEELAEEISTYSQVCFTRSFLIAFKQVGSFALIRAIERVDLHPHERRATPGLLGHFITKTEYDLTCEVEPLGTVLLSSKESEMPDILDEIRLRHPDVPLNPDARWRFFPPEGWQL
jgi:hypothetical protein